MSECWILYDRCDLEHNRFFADSLVGAGRRRGLRTYVVTTDDIPRELPDIVVNRGRDWELASRLEDSGVTVVSPSDVSRVCLDKLETYRFAETAGIPFMPVSLPGEDLPPGPPWVVKSRIGHGGSEVRMACTEDEVGSICRCMEGRLPLVQSMADRGRDMRAYVLGGRILACVMRSSSKDFRANHSLGGNACVCEPSDDVVKIVEKVCQRLRPDFVGVDFVFSDGRPVLNEIEDPVGTRMLYELTDLDPADLLMEFVYSKISL